LLKLTYDANKGCLGSHQALDDSYSKKGESHRVSIKQRRTGMSWVTALTERYNECHVDYWSTVKRFRDASVVNVMKVTRLSVSFKLVL